MDERVDMEDFYFLTAYYVDDSVKETQIYCDDVEEYLRYGFSRCYQVDAQRIGEHKVYQYVRSGRDAWDLQNILIKQNIEE